MALVLRQESAVGFVTKGTPLTNTEVDNNNVELYGLIQGRLPYTGGTLTGKLNFVAPTTSIASFSLPTGSGPTSPLNGDVWATSGGLFYRLSGVTKQLAFTDTPVGSSANADLLDNLDSSYFLDASNLNAGTVPVARLSGTYDINITGDANTLDGYDSQFYLNASNLNAGTISDARLPDTISSNITGNAATASKLLTARTISLVGDVAGSASFDGSANISITATIAANSVALGTDTTGAYVAGITAGAGIVVSGSGSEGAVPTISHADTSSQGNVSNVNYNAISAITLDTYGHITAIGSVDLTTPLNTALYNVYMNNDSSTNATRYIMFSNSVGTTHANAYGDSALTYNPATNTLGLGTLSASTISASVGSFSSLVSTPTYQINGTTVIDSGRNIVNAGNGTFSGTVSAGTYQINGTTVIDSGRNIVNAGNGTFSGTVTASTVNATNVNSTSDLNLKENVYTIYSALSTVNNLRGVEFDWKADGQHSAGVIAQEVQQVIPHAVTDAGDHLAVNYNQIIGYLVEAVKELSRQVEELKAK